MTTRLVMSLVRFALVAVFASVATPAFAQSETVEYYGLDALGSVRAIFDQQGNVVGRMDYGPFGENLWAAIKFPTEQFAQLARDAESGQDYAQARNYSARTGRFNRLDPVFASLLDPQQWNRYGYGRNNPLRFGDPSGTIIISPLCEGPCWDQGEADAIEQARLDSFNLRQPGQRPPRSRRDHDKDTPSETTPDSSDDDSEGCPTADDPGLVITLIPVIGPAISAQNNFEEGDWGWGLFDTAMAVSDLAVVKSLFSGIAKGAFKTSGFSWRNMKRWYAKTRDIPAGTPVHHWLIEQNSTIGKEVAPWIKHQPFNLMPMPDPVMHAAVHGKGPLQLGPLGQAWHGTPGWAKVTVTSGAGKAVHAACK